MERLWGIDLGGTKTECVVLAGEDFTVLARKRLPTPVRKGYMAILENIRRLIREVAREHRFPLPRRIGIGTPGSLEPRAQQLKNSNTTVLNGKPLLADLQKLLDIPVVMENDANCFALAESRLGVVAALPERVQTVFGVIMGTGVGGGIVVDGRVLKGRHGIAGEWGHNFLHESGGPCYCGRDGCVETVISGPALERYYRGLGGQPFNLEEILRRGEDALAKKTVERLVFYFGKAMAAVINILDPDVIVLGGGLGNITDLYEYGPGAIRPWLFNSHLATPLLQPALGDSAGVLGAALLTAG